MKDNIIMFILGYITSILLYSLYQDILGKERYIDYVKNNWIDSGKTITYALTGLVVIIICVIVILNKK